MLPTTSYKKIVKNTKNPTLEAGDSLWYVLEKSFLQAQAILCICVFEFYFFGWF
jgi:hypothetical protein